MTASDSPTPWRRYSRRLAHAWLTLFFWFSEHAGALLVMLRPLVCHVVFLLSPSVRNGTRANARRLLGPQSTPSQRDRLARRMLGNFYLFCCDIGQNRRSTIPQLVGRIEEISGKDLYLQTRALRKGLIVVTAHMGSFEVAMAALRSMEEHVHVLFRRDAVGGFEKLRSELRHRLGIHEAGLEEGWPLWIKLREALRADQVVVIQGDRVLPGQKGKLIPFMDAAMEFPASPITLAMVSGSPILAIFSTRTASNQIRITIQGPIHVPPDSTVARTDIHPSLTQLAAIIQHQITTYPDQWLILEPAWSQDQLG